MNYGALKSIPKNTTIAGQPHQLSYINPQEAELLKSRGGAGIDINGIPAYWTFSDPSSWGDGAGYTGDSSIGKAVADTGAAVRDAVVTAVNTGFTAVKDTYTEITTGGNAITGTYNSDAVIPTTTPSALELSMESTKTQAELEAEAKTAGQEMYMFQGNYYPVTTEFFDAFGNSYSTQAEASAADTKAEQLSTAGNAGVAVEYTSTNLPVFYDNSGFAHSTLAGAISANETESLNTALNSGTMQGPFNEQLGLTFADSRGLYHTSQSDADAANGAYVIQDSATSAASSGSDEVSDYINRFGMTGLEDRFLVGRINPNTGLPYVANDGMVNPLDADTIPYSPDGYTDAEIQLFGGDPYQTTENGIVQTDNAFRDPTTEGDGQHGQTFTDDEAVDLAVIKDGVVVDDVGSIDAAASFTDNDNSTMRDVYSTRPTYGDFYGGRSGGIWDRFRNSYLTRFGQPTEGIDEMVRVVTGEDGSKLYYGADGALLNPDAVGAIRTGGDPTTIQIGEEQVLVGQQEIGADGALAGTTYTPDYNAMSDEELFNYK